jgi:uncharacterized protein
VQGDQRPFRVLALDGGGMRGLYSAVVLDRLSRRFRKQPDREEPRDVGRGFDLIVGTSTGGILACALAAGFAPSVITEMYCRFGSTIFETSVPRNNPIALTAFALTHLFKPANDGIALRKALQTTFGDTTIGQIFESRKLALCVQAVDMMTHEPVVFKTGHQNGKQRDDGMSLVDACMATTAAPIILPLARVPIDDTERTFADGGLWAGSPVLPAVTEALKICGDCPIQVVSVGTCPPPVGRYVPPGKKWGLLQWRFGIGAIETSLDAQAVAARYQFIQLREHLRVPVSMIRLHQTSPPQDHQKYIGLDRAGPRAIDALKQLGAKDAETIHSEILEVESDLTFLRDIFENLPAAKRMN